MTTVYLEVDGQPVPAKDCVWIDTAPCGCISGVMTASSGGETYINVEQAAAHYHSNKVAKKRAEDEGFKLSLTTHEAFRAMGFAECTHEPQWGVERPVLTDGHVWGTTDGGFGRQTHIKHMVPEGCFPVRGEAYPPTGVKALCGKAVSGWWHGSEHDLWDCEPCLKCGAAAKAGTS